MASAIARFALSSGVKSGGKGLTKSGAGAGAGAGSSGAAGLLGSGASGLFNTGSGLAGGALFLGVFDDIFSFIEENPLVPIGLGGIVLFFILRKKS
jgi:hypothetical protein